MKEFRVTDFECQFPDNDSCLEWLKNRLYPNGIECHICKRVTRHHKAHKKPFYVCDICGNHVHPTAGTIFHKSTTPLKIWFEVIYRMSITRGNIPARQVQREYGVTYKTAWRMVQKSKEFLHENKFKLTNKVKADEAAVEGNKQNTGIIKMKENTMAGGVTGSEKDKAIDSHIMNARNSIYPLITPVAGKDAVYDNVNSIADIKSLTMIGTSQDNESDISCRKRDRTARLLRIQMLLCQHPQGLPVEEIAFLCSISKRTIYRDLITLESELNIPIWEDGSRRGIAEGYFLSPTNLTFPEAISIFLALRLVQNIDPMYNPVIASTFNKLSAIVPVPLRKQIQNTLKFMEKQPRKEKRWIDNFNKLIQAWLSQHKVKFLYKYEDEKKPMEHIVEPYFIEPATIGSSSYLIAFCHLRKTICTFKVKNIVGDVIIESDIYEIPDDFNAVELLGSAWGVHFTNEVETVKLHFKRRVDMPALETHFHPSQSIEMQRDGSVIITMNVRDNIRFRNWIMGWGDLVEVLEPRTLRHQIYDMAKLLVDIYNEKI